MVRPNDRLQAALDYVSRLDKESLEALLTALDYPPGSRRGKPDILQRPLPDRPPPGMPGQLSPIPNG